jgi:glycosyltransferase involved in cell wall biosynthesis
MTLVENRRPAPERRPPHSNANTLRRVAIVYDFGFVNGGAAQVAIQSAIGLAARGVQVDYFCAVGPADPRLANGGVTVTCLEQSEFVKAPNIGRAMIEGLWKQSSEKALADLLSRIDPRGAIVHFHGWTKALSSSVFAAARRSAIPAVVTLHEYFSACPNGGFYNYQRHTPCGQRAMSAGCIATHCDSRTYGHKLWRVARQAIAGGAAGLPGRDVIYLSEFSRRVLAPYFSEQTRWRKVSNGINVAKAPRVAAENNNNFLFLGRLSPEKGAPLFAEAAAKAGVRARIVGDGPERGAIARRWPQTGLPGWMASEQAMAEMANARAFVFPSLWYEVAPLTVQEALARGVPLIAADGGAARDVVADGRNGVLFRSGNAGDLAAKMAQFADSARVKAMSEAAYADYWARPATPERHIEELLAAYESILLDHA